MECLRQYNEYDDAGLHLCLAVTTSSMAERNLTTEPRSSELSEANSALNYKEICCYNVIAS